MADMQYTDRAGYDTLREHFPRLTAQLSDATNLGEKLVASNLITEFTNQSAMSHPVLSDKITALLEGVMRQGSRGAFQRFVEIILDDPASAELGTILQGSYIKKNGVWTGSKPDVVNGQFNTPPANPNLDAAIISLHIAPLVNDLPQWETVAQKFGIDVEDIITRHFRDADRRLMFLRKWTNTKGKAATYRVLHDVLTDLGEYGAAEKIRKLVAGAQHHASFATMQQVAQQQYEEAMKQGSVKMSVIKCLVLGIAGVGKTNLKRLILQEGDNETLPRVSTGLADNPVQAFVGSVKSILAEVDEKDYGKWEVMDEDKLLQVLLSAYQVEPSDQQQSGAPTTSEPSVTKQPSAGKAEIGTSDEDAAKKVNRRVFETFKKLPLRTDKKAFSVKLVQFIDSGGQPQFHELLPAFVQHISAIIFTINLSEKLENHPMIYFYGQDGKPVGEPYPSAYSHIQVLEQCVRAADSRDVHPNYKVFVVGTHKDKEEECDEKSETKEEMVSKIVKVKQPESLIAASWNETIWAVNCKCPGSTDKDVADKLRKAIISHCHNDPYYLPIKWFVLEMQIVKSATNDVLKYNTCMHLAERLGIVEEGLKAALLHMVKHNLLLWYDVESLRDVVFSDPQVILKIITGLVQFKYELAGRNVKCECGVKLAWRNMFRDLATVDHDFLSQDSFKKHFVDDIFTVEHFIQLMCHLLIMVPLKGGKYLMPALLDRSSDKISRENKRNDVEPLLVCFPNECVPYGIFSCLVAFLQKEHCKLVENSKKVPVCLHRNRVAFKFKAFPAKFTIIDSTTYIEVHLDEVDEEDTRKACIRIKNLIYGGIEECAKLLHYKSLCLKDGFICSNESCKYAAIPYEEDLRKAECTKCKSLMKLTTKQTVWLEETQTLDPFIPSSQSATEPTFCNKRYPMNASPHGIALIISNIYFMADTRLEDRKSGGESDEKTLEELFKKLNYKVVLLKNLTQGQIDLALKIATNNISYDAIQNKNDKHNLKELTKDNLVSAGHDSFVCCLMSHGDKDVVFGVDGGKFMLSSIYEIIGKCKHLDNKPKMVFIQACQGDEKATVKPLFTDGNTKKGPDFLVSSSTISGHESYRDKDGSWYVNDLFTVFNTQYKKLDALTMITEVHRRVSNRLGEDTKGVILQQISDAYTTLRASIYF